MVDETGFGKRLDEAMKKARYNNTQLTKKLDVSKNAVGNYKNNQIPNAAILYNISQILGTTVEYLLTGKNTNEITQEEQLLLNGYRNASATDRAGARKLLDVPEPEQEESSTSRTG